MRQTNQSVQRALFSLALLSLTLVLLSQQLSAAVEDADATPGKTEKVAYLGITAKSLDPALRAQLNLPEDTALTVASIDRKGPADGTLHVNDIVQKLDDQILIDSHQLVTLVHLHKPGDTITLTLLRSAKVMQVNIKLGEKERVVPSLNDPDHVVQLPGVTVPDELTSRIPFDTQLPLGTTSQVALSFSDGTYSANVKTDEDGHREMIVKDFDGKKVAQGPVDTEEQWNKFDPDIRKHLEVMHKMLARKKQ